MPSATTILITGAGSGIGAATAGLAARRGHPLILLDLDADGIRATADDARGAGVNAVEIAVDVTDAPALAAAIDRGVAEAGVPARRRLLRRHRSRRRRATSSTSRRGTGCSTRTCAARS